MKSIGICLSICLFLITNIYGQKFENLDKSPLDISYYPDNYAHDRKFDPQLIGTDTAMIRVIYSRPAKKDREIFGKLIPYGKVWRTGANEATEIKIYRNLTFGSKPLKAGTYALFTIPGENEWTIILNSDLDHWGAYSYKEDKDVLKVVVPIKVSDQTIENFSIRFEKINDKSAKMIVGWDHTIVEIPIGL